MKRPFLAKIIMPYMQWALGKRGFGRIASLFQYGISVIKKDFLIRDFLGDIIIKGRFDDTISNYIYWMGGFSNESLLWFRFQVPVDGTIIDVGANIGEYTLVAAKKSQDCRILAFEPNSSIRRDLETNINLNNFKNVTVFPVALSDKDDDMTIYQSAKKIGNGFHNNGLTTLFQTESRNISIEKVSVTTLDGCLSKLSEVNEPLKRCDIIKVDTEGAELYVLRGSIETIGKFRPILILEINKEMFIAAGYTTEDLSIFLQNVNYKPYTIDKNCNLCESNYDEVNNHLGWDNFVFIPIEKITDFYKE